MSRFILTSLGTLVSSVYPNSEVFPNMATKAETIKIGPEIDKELYTEFARIARENGQSQRYLLEKAMRQYIEFVAPSRNSVRPEVMAHFRRSTDKNRELHRQLAR
jgi:hypothetical protein